jgi:PAS domain-containing protein
MLLFLKTDDDYLVVSQGAEHIRHIGRDLRGLLLAEFNAPVSPVLKDLYDECLSRAEPIYCRFVSDLAPSSVYWEGIFLPVNADEHGSQQFVLNYNTPIDSKAEILQIALDLSPVGMITAVPFSDGKTGAHDGRIISINARAKELLKLKENGSRIHYIRDLVPWFRDVSLWTRIGVTTKGDKTHFRYRDQQDRHYLITMQGLKRFVLFSITEGDETKPVYSSGAASIGS